MSRTGTGKKLEITERDLEIFRLLHRYRYLRSTFIHAFVGGKSATRFKERLGHLYHESGYLNRPSQQWQYANARYMPVVYESTAAAREALRRHALQGGETATWLDTNCGRGRRHLAHSLMICDVLASIELGARATPGLRFISWEEILAKAPAETQRAEVPFRIPVVIPNGGHGGTFNLGLVPDGLFGIEYTRAESTAYRFFALEADRSTEPVSRADLRQSSYRKKLLAYREIVTRRLYKSHLGLPNFFVLTVTMNERHMHNIMALATELAGSTTTVFLFKTSPTLADFRKAPAPTPALLTEPWQRAGLEPFEIAR
jgi:hypothetical protein